MGVAGLLEEGTFRGITGDIQGLLWQCYNSVTGELKGIYLSFIVVL